jgi:hypothetical protein
LKIIGRKKKKMKTALLSKAASTYIIVANIIKNLKSQCPEKIISQKKLCFFLYTIKGRNSGISG